MRQYIGARYVPKFMGNYDVTQVYEALCVVDNGLGTSYISKIPTPAGTPLTDTTYWALYGSSSGAIISLQDQIDDMNDGSVNGSLQNQITALRNDVDSLGAHKYYLFQGDSYGLTNFYLYDTWTELLVNYLGLSATEYTILENDGAGFNDRGGQTNQTFQEQLEANVVSADVTDVVVCAGANDRGYAINTLKGAISSYITKARQLYPNAKIHISMIGWSETDTISRDIWANSYIAYKEATVESGAHWMESPSNAFCLYSDFEDYLHPNATGQELIARAIVNELVNNKYDTVVEKALTITPMTGATMDYNSLHFKQINKEATIRIPDKITVTFGTPFNLTQSLQQIGTLSDGVASGRQIESTIPCYYSASGSDEGWHYCTLAISGNALYVKGMFSIANINKLYISNCVFQGLVRTSM